MNDPLAMGEYGGGDDGLLGGDGLDGFLPQDDDGKYDPMDNGEEPDLFAGTDMDQKIMDPMGNVENAEMDPSMVIEESEEKSKIQQWEMEHREMLIEKRNQARAEKEKLIETAKTDIENFYEERKKKQGSIKSQNKEHEQRYFQEMKDLMQYGAPWEKVGRLVNLTPKPNEKPGTSKVGRMRRLLIQLKNEKKPNQE